MFRRKEESPESNTPETQGAGASSSSAKEPVRQSESSQAKPAGMSPQASSPSAPASASSPAQVKAPEPAKPIASPAAAAAGTPGAFRPAAAPSNLSAPRAAAPAAASADSRSPLTSSDKGMKTSKRILTVGNDILLKGEIATCDRLVIEGEVDAKLNDVHTVEIAETGSFKGTAEIEDAEISGVFEGELVVRGRLIIYSTGRVRGKITYGEIEIERGGELTGEIKMSGSPGIASNDKQKEAA